MKFSLLFLVIFGIVLTSTSANESTFKVQNSIFKTLEEKGSVNILVSFKESDLAKVRNAATSQEFSSKSDLVTSMYIALKNYARSTQAKVIERLSRMKSNFKEVVSFWITNQVGIIGADKNVLRELLDMGEIVEIIEDKTFKIKLPKENFEVVNKPLEKVQWGVYAISAPEVWKMENKGAGVVVAGIDSGVQGSHEALQDNFRSENGWFDPIYDTLVPTDVNGHGTHTMGTIVGRLHGIGVAPEAQWIACRAGYNNGDLDYIYLLQCAQFIVCPTDPNGDNPRCDLVPDVVNNSWGNTEDIPFYNDIIDTWIKAGITPVFAAGNSGPTCSTVGSPGTHPDVISVGSISPGFKVSAFSSRGPSNQYKSIQPDVAGPGENIISAIPTNNKYGISNGTSMAAPHVSGIVALLKSKKKDLTVAEIKKLIIAGAKPVISVKENCDKKPDSEYPNNQVGYGRVNASASIEAIQHLGNSSQSYCLRFLKGEFMLLLLITFAMSKGLTV